MAVRAPRGNSALRVEVQGATGIRRALRPLLEPEMTANVDKANRKGANLYARRLRPAVGVVSSRMKKAVRVKRAKTGKPGWVIGSRRKVAFFWPFVIGGTRPHGPKKARVLRWEAGGQTIVARRVRGVGANPIVERVGRDSESEVARTIDQAFAQETGL